MATERQIKMSIIENAELIANSIAKGKDVELRKSVNGVSVAEVEKKVLKK